MPKQRFTTEAIIHKLREADVLSGQGKTIAEVCKQLGVTDKTYFRWRKTHGGLRIDQAKRMKELESENARLKKAVADLTIDKIILACCRFSRHHLKLTAPVLHTEQG